MSPLWRISVRQNFELLDGIHLWDGCNGIQVVLSGVRAPIQEALAHGDFGAVDPERIRIRFALIVIA